jgi:GABA permease
MPDEHTTHPASAGGPALAETPLQQGVDEPRLSRGLRQRHVTMIGFGGIIGAGLFVGSGAVINQAGPGAVVSYLLAGIIVMLTMRMLGEMAVARPATGSFVEYSRAAFGNWAGFTMGWLYWYFWVIVLAVEAVAGATIIQGWLPGVPIWVSSLVLMTLLTTTNLFSVRSYGEFEFWFASIKVAAIIVFAVIMLAALFGVIGGTGASVSNLTSHGGFFAQGNIAVLSAVSAVMFAIIGGEIATIAAAESDQPSKAVARTTQLLAVRISIFYIVSVLLIVMVLPWNSTKVGTSPFSAALDQVGIAGSADLMNAIVLTAVLSCLNSGIYIASRMMFVLSANGDAPKGMEKLSPNGVPVRAILSATVIGFASVIFEAISPNGVFQFLLNTSGVVVLLVYVMIAASELVLRRKLEATDPESLTLKMWLFPGLTIATIAGMLAVLVSMLFIDSVRSQLYWSLASAAFVLCAYWVRERVYQGRPRRTDSRQRDGIGIVVTGSPQS